MTILEFHREKDFQPVMDKECKEKNVTSVGTFPSVKLQTNEMVSQVSTDLRVKRKLIDAIIFTFSPHKKRKKLNSQGFLRCLAAALSPGSCRVVMIQGRNDHNREKKKKHHHRNYKLRKRSPMRKFSPPPVRWLRVMRRLGDGEVILLMAEPL